VEGTKEEEEKRQGGKEEDRKRRGSEEADRYLFSIKVLCCTCVFVFVRGGMPMSGQL
jgi:hypothetical protein